VFNKSACSAPNKATHVSSPRTHLYVGLVGLYVGLVGLYVGLVGLYVGDVGLYVGLVGLYVGDVGLYVGLVGLYVGDVGLRGRKQGKEQQMFSKQLTAGSLTCTIWLCSEFRLRTCPGDVSSNNNKSRHYTTTAKAFSCSCEMCRAGNCTSCGLPHTCT
jgi:hypothetical protein